jgi:hypothetical protein
MLRAFGLIKHESRFNYQYEKQYENCHAILTLGGSRRSFLLCPHKCSMLNRKRVVCFVFIWTSVSELQLHHRSGLVPSAT